MIVWLKGHPAVNPAAPAAVHGALPGLAEVVEAVGLLLRLNVVSGSTAEATHLTPSCQSVWVMTIVHGSDKDVHVDEGCPVYMPSLDRTWPQVPATHPLE